MSGRLITSEAASAAMLRQWIRHDAERASSLIWWQIYTPVEALSELQGLARLAAIRAGGLECSPDAVARQLMVETYRRHRDAHYESMRAISSSVTQGLREGRARADIAATAASIAKSSQIPLPVYLMTEAIESAQKDFRISAAWRKKQARSG